MRRGAEIYTPDSRGLLVSAKVTELYMVLGEPGNGRLVAKVWLERAGDLYVTTHAPVPMAGKWSHHASGMSHQDVPLIRRRIGMGEPKSEDLRNIRHQPTVARFTKNHVELCDFRRH